VRYVDQSTRWLAEALIVDGSSVGKPNKRLAKWSHRRPYPICPATVCCPDPIWRVRTDTSDRKKNKRYSLTVEWSCCVFTPLCLVLVVNCNVLQPNCAKNEELNRRTQETYKSLTDHRQNAVFSDRKITSSYHSTLGNGGMKWKLSSNAAMWDWRGST